MTRTTAIWLPLVLASCSSGSSLQVQGAAGGNCPTCKTHGINGGGSTGGHGSSGASSGGGSTSAGASTGGTSAGATGGGSSSGGSSGAACIPPPGDGGCWANVAQGGSCVTLADCAAGLACIYTGCQTGTCQSPPTAPTLACTANGQACDATTPPCCGGQCRAGVCTPWTRCGETTDACQSDLDCCNDFTCQGGTCQPTCGQLFAGCQTTSDCCYHHGLECLLIPALGEQAVCYPGTPSQPKDSQGNEVLCGAPCSGWECQLGAACEVDGGIDPCAAAGEVCDQSYGVCRNPQAGSPLAALTEACLPSGEPCLPILGSNVQPVCASGIAVNGVAGTYCVQACQTSADCVDPIEDCLADPAGGGSFCAQWDSCTASQFFGACDAAGSADGLCYPQDFGSGPQGYCLQATLDGGAAGDRCLADIQGSRQQGGLCDTNDVCNLLGLCEPVCNSGSSGTPACPAGQQCFPFLVNAPSLPIEMGYCSQPCDFTAADGGGCPLDSTGVQEKCVPQAVVNQTDSPIGICAAGAAVPVALGQVCPFALDGQVLTSPDPCVPGSLCLGATAVDTLRTCLQLCNRVGQSAGCPAGQLCKPMIVSGLSGNPTHTGYCQ